MTGVKDEMVAYSAEIGGNEERDRLNLSPLVCLKGKYWERFSE